MNFRVVAGYFGEFTDEAKQANLDLDVIGITFQYQCNLVFPDGAGPNFGIKTDHQAVDVFDALRVAYDGYKVQAGLVQAMGLVDYQLIGARYELNSHDFREVELSALNTNLETMPGLLVQGPMPVHYVTYHRTTDPIAQAGFSGDWEIGDGSGFRQLSADFDETVRTPVMELATVIDQLGQKIQQQSVGNIRLITGIPDHLIDDTHQAEVRAWYELTQQSTDSEQALQSIQDAREANDKLLAALTRIYPG